MKTLIVYSSTYGFTERCVRRLATNLVEGADIIRLKTIVMPNITEYDQIIIGTPIYMGQINSWIKMFCENKLDQLLEKQVSVFVCCGLLDQAYEIIGTSFPRQLIIAAKSVEVLGGEVAFERLRWYHKAVVKAASIGHLLKQEEVVGGPGLLYQNHRRLVRNLNG